MQQNLDGQTVRDLAGGFFTDCDQDGRAPNDENLRAWLWFTCPAHMRPEAEAAIRADARFKRDLETITCIECGRIFTQGTDSGRPYGECPGCGHTNSAMDRAFGIQQGEELVMLTDCRGERGLDLYAVPAGTDNPQDAVQYRRVAYWSQDGEYGEWIKPDGEPSGITDRHPARYIGEAR